MSLRRAAMQSGPCTTAAPPNLSRLSMPVGAPESNQPSPEEPLSTLSLDTALDLIGRSNAEEGDAEEGGAEEGGAEEGGAEEGGAGGCAANWPDLDAPPFKRAFSQEEVAKAFTEAFENRREREKMLDRQGVNGTTCRAVLDGHDVVIKRHESRVKAAHEQRMHILAWTHLKDHVQQSYNAGVKRARTSRARTPPSEMPLCLDLLAAPACVEGLQPLPGAANPAQYFYTVQELVKCDELQNVGCTEPTRPMNVYELALLAEEDHKKQTSESLFRTPRGVVNREYSLKLLERFGYAIGCLHSMGLLHNDLHSHNVFVLIPRLSSTQGEKEAAKARFKFIDFGEATEMKLIRDKKKNAQMCKTQSVWDGELRIPDMLKPPGVIAQRTGTRGGACEVERYNVIHNLLIFVRCHADAITESRCGEAPRDEDAIERLHSGYKAAFQFSET